MTPRLSEIAAQAGVSQATVSRVLNGRPGVSAASRQAVVTALDVLGYERPAPLRRISHSGLIGLITPELSNPIFPAIAQVIQTALISHGYASVLCTHEMGGITEDDYTELLLERGVSGIVFVSGMHADSRADPKRYQRLIERRLPIVLVNGYVPGIPAPFVSTDDGAAAELAVNHLRALGHRRIGLAAGQERFVPVIRKIEGYRRAMAGALGPAELDRLVMPTLFTVEGGHAAARALLDEGCTAICCASDLMALGAFRAVRERGLRVPEDVSVVGFDDAPLMAYTDPPLTTVRQATRDLALAAVQALLDAIAGAETPRGEYLFQPELVVRNSTAPAV